MRKDYGCFAPWQRRAAATSSPVRCGEPIDRGFSQITEWRRHRSFDVHRARLANTIAAQKQHDFADDILLCPAGDDRLGILLARRSGRRRAVVVNDTNFACRAETNAREGVFAGLPAPVARDQSRPLSFGTILGPRHLLASGGPRLHNGIKVSLRRLGICW